VRYGHYSGCSGQRVKGKYYRLLQVVREKRRFISSYSFTFSDKKDIGLKWPKNLIKF
jgi:hypothetical protein